MKEKMKIQSQLRCYEEREKTYLANIRAMEEHNAFIYEMDHSLKQENNLLTTIVEKRLQIGRNIES